MERLRVLLVDDEAQHRQILRDALAAFPFVAVAGEAGGGQEAVAFLQRERVNLVFLDIEMRDVDGFHLARHIQAGYPGIQIVFLTGHIDFAFDSYEYEPADFLVKPVDLIHLERALRRVLNRQAFFREAEDVLIGIHVDGGLEILNVGDIIYLEKTGRRVTVTGRKGICLSSCDSLQQLQKVFEPYGFFRCHQSFLVSLGKIRGIRSDAFRSAYILQMADTDQRIPLSRDKYAELRALLERRGLTIC